jgi:ABC-type phosphate transport system auxiliary subunit
VKRKDHPFAAWMVDHLPTVWLLAGVTTIALVALLLHFA